MYFSQIHVDQYGPLKKLDVANLSSSLTVLHGAEGCGKSTFVRFLRGLFFGFARWSNVNAVEHSVADSGSVRFQANSGPRVLRRSWLDAARESSVLTDDYGRTPLTAEESVLPGWVTEDVYREVFTVDRSEAERFDLLTRLCLECDQLRPADTELRQAEQALAQAVRDRDGNGVHGGVVHHISELRRRQGELLREMAALRKPNGDLNARIEATLKELAELADAMARLDQRVRLIDTEIMDLELRLAALRQKNSVTLNRPHLEEQIRSVSARLDRWREIRAMIEREQSGRRTQQSSMMNTQDGLLSLRALVSRIEERTQRLAETSAETVARVGTVVDTDAVRLLRGEVAALCQYLTWHEQQCERHTETMLSMTAERSLADAAQMIQLLEGQVQSLRLEQGRSENVLQESSLPPVTVACSFTGHRELPATLLTNGYGSTELEAQIARLKSERASLVNERQLLESQRATKQLLLEKLRSEQANTATLEQLDELRSRFAEIDAEVTLLEEERRQLDRTEATLKDLIARLRTKTLSPVFDLASQFMRRLTDGECFQLSGSLPDRLMVHSSLHREPVGVQHLSRSSREMAGLAMRLALLHVRAQMNHRVPVILDDVYVTGSDIRSQNTARLLMEVADAGQQILFLTPSPEVADVFTRMNADVRQFQARREVVVPPPVPVQLHAWVEPQPEPAPMPIEAPPQQQVLPQPVASSEPVSSTNWLFYLEVDHGVEDLAGITLGELEALRASGILTIDDLLQRTIPQLEEATRLKGFLVSVERLQALRGQAELATRVPMLRRGDAALLFASGIHTVDDLSRLRPETVYDRVTDFQRSDAGVRYRRGGRLIDRQQAMNWARFGQFSRSLDDARHSRSRFGVRTPKATAMAPMPGVTVSSAGERKERTLQPEATAPPTTKRRRRRAAEDLNVEERRARRLARRKRLASQLKASTQPVDEETVPVERVGGMRFFLSRTSDVERAPSIGPRTAQMLHSIGVRTVEELLSMAPERIADKLNHRRITATVIQQWQNQARLICQIPELRGHDAQILVAVGILTPEALASRKPAELLAQVEPFVRTTEGERILRKGRKPDLAEVTEWIQWAANARPMKAA
ncbi:MAG: DUF4332 domain-containing protein [Planctomycetaceae bacterium]|nr:DUF4332 domain-containing protein [Planctomycetaceae bacterium]